MRAKSWFTLLMASMLMFGCSDVIDVTDSDSGDNGETGNSGDTGNTENSNNNPGGTTQNPGEDVTDHVEQVGGIDVDVDFDASLLDNARKLSENVLEIYYKSKGDSDFGTHEKLFDMSSLPGSKKSTEFVHEGSTASAKWTSNGINSRFYFFQDQPPKDLSQYNVMAFWMYVPEESVGGKFSIYVSTNTLTPAYIHTVNLSKPGWNYVRLRLSSFTIDDDKNGNVPGGWDKMTSFLMYELTDAGKFTVYIDDVYLYSDIRDVDLTDSVVPKKIDGALFALNGSRAIIENQLIKNSFEDDDSIVYQEGKSPVYQKDKEFWLPLNVIGSRYDKDAVYNDKSHIIRMKLNGKTYIYQAGKDKVLIDGKPEKLDFKVGLNGDSLFVPKNYIKKLLGYKNEYYDVMGWIYLYNDDNPIPDFNYYKKLDVAYEMLFSRPDANKILKDMKNHLGGDVHPRILASKDILDNIVQYYKNGDGDEQFKKDTKRLLGDGFVKYMYDTGKTPYVYNIFMAALAYKLSGDDKYKKVVWDNVVNLENIKNTVNGEEVNNWTADIAGGPFGIYLVAISIAYDWLYNEWSADEKKKIEQLVYDRAFKPEVDRLTSTDPKAKKTLCPQSPRAGVSNTLCNAGFLVASVAFANVPDKLGEAAKLVMTNSMKKLELGLYEFGPDGAYSNLAYWQTSSQFMYYLVSTLDAAVGTNYGLFYTPGYPQSSRFSTFMSTAAGPWNYHDGAWSYVYTEHLPWFAKKLNDPRINRIRRNSIAQEPSIVIPYSDILWYEPGLMSKSDELPQDVHYDQQALMLMHSSWHAEKGESDFGYDENSIMVGLHGGENTGVLSDLLQWDIGEFVIFGATQRFVADIGAEYWRYAKDFNSEILSNKCKLYVKRAEGHNTLVIGDVTQKSPDQVSGAYAKMLRTESNAKSAIGVVDMAPAYEQIKEGDGARGVFFKNNRSVIVVQDEIALSSPEIVRWAVHTSHLITISNDGKRAKLCDPQYWDGSKNVTCAPKQWNKSKNECNSTSKDGLYCLYAEIVSDNASLKFSDGAPKSFAADYQAIGGERKLQNYRKLMIITKDAVEKFNTAVVFKMVKPEDIKDDVMIDDSGKLYQWTDMKNWKLE